MTIRFKNIIAADPLNLLAHTIHLFMKLSPLFTLQITKHG